MLEEWNLTETSEWRQTGPSTWSRAAGLNEIGFYYYGQSDEKAPSDVFCRVSIENGDGSHSTVQSRIEESWTQLRLLHPLLDSQFRKDQDGKLFLDYIWQERQERVHQSMVWQSSILNWDEIRDEITNCPRIISDQHLSQLRIYAGNAGGSRAQSIEIVLVCSHAIADGIRIVSTMNDFMHLLGNGTLSQLHEVDIRVTLEFVLSRLPRAMESQLPERQQTPRSRWKEAIAHVLHNLRQQSNTGAPHPVFQACSQPPITRQKLHDFAPRETKLLRETCRKNGCTLGHLIYAASVAAFTELTSPQPGSLAFVGTPINARRLFHADFRDNADELVLALSFLGVFLPCVQINCDKTERNASRLWTLARMAKSAVHGTIEDPLYQYYSFIDGQKRVARYLNPPTDNGAQVKGPLRQLTFGSSSIGDLNAILQTDSIPLQINDVGVGMRARQGEALMHSYSFAQKLRLSLIYDAQLGADRMDQWLHATAKLMLMVLPSDELDSLKLACM